MSQEVAVNGAWTLLDAAGESAIAFTSFISIDYRNDGQALAYPVESGGFASYNKVATPLEIRVTLATQGSEADFEYILYSLDRFQAGTNRLAVATPAALYRSMTLESYSYRRTREAGAGMLVVELTLKEVREIRTMVTNTVISRPKNPSSSENSNTGKTQTQELGSSALADLIPD